MSKWSEILKKKPNTQINLQDSSYRDIVNSNTTSGEITVNEKAVYSQLIESSNSSLIIKEEQIKQNLFDESIESIKNNKEIDLSGIKIGEKEAIILAEAIKINTTATSVVMGSNNCEKGALKYITQALKTKTNLTSIIILDGTVNRPIHSLDEFKYLAEVFESNKNFVYVNIEGTI